MTLSNKITFSRILSVPFIFYSIINHNWLTVFWLIIFAAITDILDGKIARARNEITPLGTCLDPISDKLLMLSCYFALAYTTLSSSIIPMWFFWLIFIKELLLILGGIIVLNLTGKVIPAKPVGKVTMVIQIIFVAWLALYNYFNLNLVIFNQILLWIVILFVLISLIQYIKIGFEQFKNNSETIMKYFFLFTLFCVNASDEFIIPKKTEKSQTKLKDNIIAKSGTILNLNTELDETSLQLRKFILNQTETAIKDENQFLLNANQKDLKIALNELNDLERDINNSISELKKRLSNLKKKFNIKNTD